jgi:hypothetical protein
MWLIGWAVVLGEAVALGYLVWLYAEGFIVIVFDKGTDVSTLMLAAATLVVTGVGVAVAVVTIWGYREIRDRAVAMAVKAALKAVSQTVRSAYETGTSSPDSEDANAIALSMDTDE